MYSSSGALVLYWYKTIRDPKAPGGARFEPELIDTDSGVGSTVLATDLNKDGSMDVVTGTKLGTFIFWGQKHTESKTRKFPETGKREPVLLFSIYKT